MISRRLSSLTLVLIGCLSQAALSAIESDTLEEELSRAISDPDHRRSLTVENSISVVFDTLLTGLAEYTEGVSELDFDHSEAEVPGVLGVGSRRITTMDDGSILVQRILLFEPPNLFAYFTDMSQSTVSVPIEYSIGHYSLTESEEGLVEATVSVAHLPSSRLTAFLVRIGFNRALARDLEKAQAYLATLK